MKVSVSRKRSVAVGVTKVDKSSESSQKLRIAKAMLNAAKNRKRFEALAEESGDLLRRIEGTGLIVGRR